jgi:hypothetical protein
MKMKLLENVSHVHHNVKDVLMLILVKLAQLSKDIQLQNAHVLTDIMNIIMTVTHVTSNVILVTLTKITVLLVLITEVVNQLVLPVHMDISMIQSMLIVKIVQVNSLIV